MCVWWLVLFLQNSVLFSISRSGPRVIMDFFCQLTAFGMSVQLIAFGMRRKDSEGAFQSLELSVLVM